MAVKDVLKGAAVVTAILAWFALDAMGDYKWADARCREKESEGWTLIASLDNFADLASPWTLVKTPVTGLWFTKQDKLRVSEGVILAPILHVRYDYSKTSEDDDVEAFDVAAGKLAILPDKTSDLMDSSKLEWHTYDAGTPGAEMLKYFQGLPRSK